MMKKNLKDVEATIVNALKNVSVENGKESMQRIIGSILKKHNVDFDHIIQKQEYLAIYKEDNKIGNIFIDSETIILKSLHCKDTEIEYDVFRKLEVL